MESEGTSSLIDRWFVDYYSQIVWKQFDKDGRIESRWIREFIAMRTRSDNFLDSTDEELQVIHLSIELMYKLSFGDKSSSDCHGSGQSVLEDALDIVNQLVQKAEFRDRVGQSVISRAKLLLKQQAVLVCCRNNDFDLATSVFERQWGHCRNVTEMKVRQEITDALVQRNSKDVYFDTNPYSVLIECSQTLLRKIYSSLKTPFLTIVGQYVWKHYEEIMQSEKPKEADQTPNERTAHNQLNSSFKEKKTTKRRYRTKNKPVREAKISDTQNSTLLDDRQPRSASKAATGYKNKAENKASNFGAESFYSEDTKFTSLPPELSDDQQECKKPQFDSSMWEDDFEDLPNKKQKTRTIWLQEEEEKIYLGVQKFGIGQWKKIADFLGSHRSNIDVKDKWRTMFKQGKLKNLQDLYGPIE